LSVRLCMHECVRAGGDWKPFRPELKCFLSRHRLGCYSRQPTDTTGCAPVVTKIHKDGGSELVHFHKMAW
jgi:hypothetical protein